MAKRPIDVINDAVFARSVQEQAAQKERNLHLPPGFVGEVLASGGVVGLYFNRRDRERYGWTGCATGGKVTKKRSALNGLHGDSVFNSWSPGSGIQTISVNFVDPALEATKWHASPRGARDSMGVAVEGAITAEHIGDRIVANPISTELEILNSPWLTVSRFGLQTMLETVHPDGYLAKLIPELDRIVFEDTHLTKKQLDDDWAKAIGWN